MRHTRIKICCISTPLEAHIAIEAGADALGLVSEMPSGPGTIGEDLIAEIAAMVPPPIATFLLTSKLDASAIIDQQRRCGANTLQIVDSVDPSVYGALREALPGVSLVQVIHVNGPDDVAQARRIAPMVDAVLMDSGKPSAAVKTLGGTGDTHDWGLSRSIRESIDTPLFLAGGLRAQNVGLAIETVQPFGVDVCSGVRTDGALDPDKLRAFVARVRGVSDRRP